MCQLYTFKGGYHNAYEETGRATIGLQGWEVDLGREQGRDSSPLAFFLAWDRYESATESWKVSIVLS